jgi:hypothetical protein
MIIFQTNMIYRTNRFILNNLFFRDDLFYYSIIIRLLFYYSNYKLLLKHLLSKLKKVFVLQS